MIKIYVGPLFSHLDFSPHPTESIDLPYCKIFFDGPKEEAIVRNLVSEIDAKIEWGWKGKYKKTTVTPAWRLIHMVDCETLLSNLNDYKHYLLDDDNYRHRRMNDRIFIYSRDVSNDTRKVEYVDYTVMDRVVIS